MADQLCTDSGPFEKAPTVYARMTCTGTLLKQVPNKYFQTLIQSIH